VLVSLSVKLLTDDASGARETASWLLVGFTGGYSLLHAFLGRRRAR
jgi:hypothetical protein